MRRHTADVQARRQDGGAGRALRHLGDPVGKFFPLKILAGILYFPVPGVEKKKKLPVPRVTEISTVHLFISNLTRAVWGLAYILHDDLPAVRMRCSMAQHFVVHVAGVQQPSKAVGPPHSAQRCDLLHVDEPHYCVVREITGLKTFHGFAKSTRDALRC